MSLLSALNDVQRLSSLPVTAAIVGNGEESQQLLLGLARTAANQMLRKKPWALLQLEHTFTTSAATLQADGLPDDFDRLLKGTFWNADQRRQLVPTSARDWRRLVSSSSAGSSMQYYRLRARRQLHIYPAPDAGVNMVFDYISNALVLDHDGVTYKSNLEADTDDYVFGDETLKLDVRWRYLQEKGLEYAEALKDFEVWCEGQFNADEVEGDSSIALTGFEADDGMPANFPDGDFESS